MASIFTKIINREIPATIEYEDEDLIVIHDIQPQAKTHLLIIPKKEISTLNDIVPEDSQLIAKMLYTAKEIASNKGISEGYQLKIHIGEQ